MLASSVTARVPVVFVQVSMNVLKLPNKEYIS